MYWRCHNRNHSESVYNRVTRTGGSSSGPLASMKAGSMNSSSANGNGLAILSKAYSEIAVRGTINFGSGKTELKLDLVEIRMLDRYHHRTTSRDSTLPKFKHCITPSTVELLMWNTVGKGPQGIPYDGYSRRRLHEGKFATICVGTHRKVGNRLCLRAVVLLHIFEDLQPAVHDVLMPFIFFKWAAVRGSCLDFGPSLARGFVGWGTDRIEISGSFHSVYPNYICVGQWNATQQSSAKNSPATENFLSGPPVQWNIGLTEVFHIPDHG
ncbi:hypothetical protein B0H14DRAFT_2557028 [Mycena olivaceomarginata]|nr:hypothetical protein B0H14DRAFT_2557028 [Mycena olivaceomarginata]